MTETASGAGARKTRGDGLRVQRKGLTVERVYTTAGRAPVRRGDVGAARRRPDELEDG